MRVLNAILCDDVRVEDSRKHILIGVYTGDVLVKSLPYDMNLFVWLQVDEITGTSLDLEFRLSLNGNDLAKAAATLKIEVEGALVTLPLGRLTLRAESEGRLQVDLREAGKRWKPALSKEIKIAPT